MTMERTKECIIQLKILLVQFSTLRFHFSVRTDEGVISTTSVRFFPHDNGKKKRTTGEQRREGFKSLVLEVKWTANGHEGRVLSLTSICRETLISAESSAHNVSYSIPTND
jgi:hypothetical protein